MYPKTAEEWWLFVEKHWPDLQGIFFQFLPMHEYTDIDGNLVSKPLRAVLEELRISQDRELARYFQAAWGSAPDNPSIHDIPGWHVLCNLCSEVDVLYTEEEINGPMD